MKTESGLINNMKLMYKGHIVDPGRRIRFCRHMREMEAKELAIKAGLSPSYMSRLELNKSKAHPETYDRIAKALRLSTDELFGIKTINWNR